MDAIGEGWHFGFIGEFERQGGVFGGGFGEAEPDHFGEEAVIGKF